MKLAEVLKKSLLLLLHKVYFNERNCQWEQNFQGGIFTVDGPDDRVFSTKVCCSVNRQYHYFLFFHEIAFSQLKKNYLGEYMEKI